MATITVTQPNADAFTAYIAMRLAQDGATLTADQALTELLMIGGINIGATTSGPSVKNHGGRFV
jgi:hypothetical protein